jgi:hypothetical protein
MIIENILLTIGNTFLFFSFAVFFWYIPGKAFFSKVKFKSKLELIFLSIMMGFSSFAFLTFILRLIGLPFWLVYLPFLIVAFKTLKKDFSLNFNRGKISLRKIKISSSYITLLSLLIIGSIIQSMVLLRSGVITSNGIQFTELSFHDSVWHIYLIDELKEFFPPRHPGFTQVTIKNYHFLLDLTLAAVSKYLPFSTFEIYYRITPFFISILFSLGVFVFTKRISKSEKIANMAVFLTLFSGNASWFFQFFRGDEFRFSSDTFMLDAITFMLHNPHAVIVFPLLLAGIMSLQFFEESKNLRWIIYSVITFGVMIGFKAWGGSLLIISLTVAALWQSVIQKKYSIWVILILTITISLIVFLPLYDSSTAAKPVFIPGWLLNRMIEDPNRYNMLKYFFLEQYYRETNNWIRLIQIYLNQTLIYLIGNLWLRTLGLFVLIRYFLREKSTSLILILSMILGSLFIPLLFNQGRMSYDIIQFGPYSLLLTSIFSAIALEKLSRLFPKAIQLPILLLLLLMFIPSNSQRLKDWFNDKTIYISHEELASYNYLKENSEPSSTILLYPAHENISTAKVSAFTKRPTYFSAKTFTIITGEDYDAREEELKNFFENADINTRLDFLNKNSIDYIYLSSQEDKKNYLSNIQLERVFKNNKATIYKVNPMSF